MPSVIIREQPAFLTTGSGVSASLSGCFVQTFGQIVSHKSKETRQYKFDSVKPY